MTSDDIDPGPPSIPISRKKKFLLISGALTLIVGALLSVYCYTRTPGQNSDPEHTEDNFPPDPRLAYSGPFRNVPPNVEYVGDEKCLPCHQDIHRTYAKHPMGRSLVPIARLAGEQTYDAAHHNPFEAFDILFRVDRRGDRVSHRQTRLDAAGVPIYDFAHEVDFVIGSGGRGHSYLSIRDGFVFQTPISWFSRNQRWDLSPGFPPWARAGRPIDAACLSCHANRVEPVENTRHRFHEPVFRGHAIGCERCHGPGGRHVLTSDKYDIVDPKRLEPPLREAVCQQCHLEGAARVLRQGRGLNDFRPGMPLQDFFSVFVWGRGASQEKKAVNHVEQMVQSKCFLGGTTKGKMGCITCHDPHQAVAPERRIAHYRERCFQCHKDAGCSVPEAARRKKEPADSCIACHMPSSANTDIVHTASTDHRVVRKAGEEPANRHGIEPRPHAALVDFYRGVPDLGNKEAARDLAMAHYQLTLSGHPLTEADGAFAIRSLSESLKDVPGDLAAWEAKGKLLQVMRQPLAAIETFEALLARAPRHEGALVTLGTLTHDLGRKETALGYWRRAVEINPWVADYRKYLVIHLAYRGAWEELDPHAQKWLELDPASVDARQMWVLYLLETGRETEAKAEFAKVRALRPANLKQMEAWFEKQLQGLRN